MKKETTVQSFGKFLGRHLSLYLLVLIGLFLLDVLLFLLTFQGTVRYVQEESPARMLTEVAKHLERPDGSYSLPETFSKLLKEKKIWGILIDDAGNVVWKEYAPKEVPASFTPLDVASFSKGYLAGYPVFTWEQGENLLVLGYPKDSYTKITSNYLPVSTLRVIPVFFLLILVADIFVLFLAYVFSKRGVMKKVSPILQGIACLSRGESVSLAITGDLSEIGESVNEASRLLKKQDKARANYISGISHDIRTPLSMIMGYADKLSASLPEPSSQKQALIIKQQSVKIRDLVSDLNLVNRLTYENQPFQKEPVFLSRLIRTLVAETLNEALDDRFSFDLSLSPMAEGKAVTGDPRLLSRAIQNLILNSQNHNPDGCAISIRLQVCEKLLLLQFQDNGQGVPKEQLLRLKTTPHYLTSTDDRLDLRHGLGLLLVKEIVAIHGGRMELWSEEGEGFGVQIFLPL